MAKENFRFGTIPDYLAGSRMHTGSKTIDDRDSIFRASMSLLKRHYGYVPFSWVFGYAAFPYGKQTPNPSQPSKIDDQHEKQQMGTPSSLRHWFCEPGASLAERVPGR